MESESRQEIERPATPTFLTTGDEFKDVRGLPEFNPLAQTRIPDAVILDEQEKVALGSLGTKAVLSDLDRIKIQNYMERRIHQIEQVGLELERKIRHQAVENSDLQRTLKNKEKKLDRMESEIAKKDRALVERERIIDFRDKIMDDMPANMDEAGTRNWLVDQRKFLLATFRAIAEHSTDDRLKMQALTRLSDEDRGQHGKGLREDPDSGPGFFVLKPGEYGIPA